MEAEFLDPPFRILVTSSSRAQTGLKFLVDLSEHNFNGACSCENFSLTRINEVRAGKRSQCKHIDVARDFFCDWMLKRLKQEMQ